MPICIVTAPPIALTLALTQSYWDSWTSKLDHSIYGLLPVACNLPGLKSPPVNALVEPRTMADFILPSIFTVLNKLQHQISSAASSSYPYEARELNQLTIQLNDMVSASI